MRYKKGDKVRIRKDLVIDNRYGNNIFVESMIKYFDKNTKIIKVRKDYYRLKCDNGTWRWSDDMLELISKKPKMGDLVEVSDDGVNWKPEPRILIKLCDNGVVTTALSSNDEFLDNKTFHATTWKYWRWPVQKAEQMQKQEPKNLRIKETCFICKSVSNSGDLFCNKFKIPVKANSICDDFERLIL